LDRLDAVDARQHHVHQHRIKAALHDAIRRVLSPADELRLMAKLGQDGIEHHTAERIVLDAQNAQTPRVILWTIVPA